MSDEELETEGTDDEMIDSIMALRELGETIGSESEELESLYAEAKQTPVTTDRLQMFVLRIIEYLRNSTVPIMVDIANSTANMGIELMDELQPDDSQLLPEDADLFNKTLVMAAQLVAELEAVGDDAIKARCSETGKMIAKSLERIKEIRIPEDDEDEDAAQDGESN